MEKNKFLKELVSTVNENERLNALQQDFENGKILEEDMSDEERKKLEDLYKQQVMELNLKIKTKQNEIKQKRKKLIEVYKYAIEEHEKKKNKKN